MFPRGKSLRRLRVRSTVRVVWRGLANSAKARKFELFKVSSSSPGDTRIATGSRMYLHWRSAYEGPGHSIGLTYKTRVRVVGVGALLGDCTRPLQRLKACKGPFSRSLGPTPMGNSQYGISPSHRRQTLGLRECIPLTPNQYLGPRG